MEEKRQKKMLSEAIERQDDAENVERIMRRQQEEDEANKR